MKQFKKNKPEIVYNLINSGMAGTLVLLGSFADGNVSLSGIGIAFVASLIIMVTKFKDYWTTQKKEYKCSVLNFI